MKTPPDLRQEASISVVTSNREIRQDGPKPFCLTLPSQSNLKSVSATKDDLEPGCRTHERDRGRIGLTTPASPVRDRTSTQHRIRRGKWGLHA